MLHSNLNEKLIDERVKVGHIRIVFSKVRTDPLWDPNVAEFRTFDQLVEHFRTDLEQIFRTDDRVDTARENESQKRQKILVTI